MTIQELGPGLLARRQASGCLRANLLSSTVSAKGRRGQCIAERAAAADSPGYAEGGQQERLQERLQHSVLHGHRVVRMGGAGRLYLGWEGVALAKKAGLMANLQLKSVCGCCNGGIDREERRDP